MTRPQPHERRRRVRATTNGSTSSLVSSSGSIRLTGETSSGRARPIVRISGKRDCRVGFAAHRKKLAYAAVSVLFAALDSLVRLDRRRPDPFAEPDALDGGIHRRHR